jgi:hypothetical protein
MASLDLGPTEFSKHTANQVTLIIRLLALKNGIEETLLITLVNNLM